MFVTIMDEFGGLDRNAHLGHDSKAKAKYLSPFQQKHPELATQVNNLKPGVTTPKDDKAAPITADGGQSSKEQQSVTFQEDEDDEGDDESMQLELKAHLR